MYSTANEKYKDVNQIGIIIIHVIQYDISPQGAPLRWSATRALITGMEVVESTTLMQQPMTATSTPTATIAW